MSVKLLLSAIGFEKLFHQFPLNTIWEETKHGFNITEIKCPQDQIKLDDNVHQKFQCVFNQFENIQDFISIGFYENSNDVYSVKDSFSIMNPIAPIMLEISKRANKSMFTYLYPKSMDNREYYLGASNQIDIVNCKPCIYNEDMLNKLGCARPLYISNQISFLSTVDRIDDYDLTSMLKVYHRITWMSFGILLLTLISITSMKSTLWNSFWSFIAPIFDQSNPRAIKSFIYISYLLALIPFLGIIKNELLTNLITVKEKSYDTIDDLLHSNAKIFMFEDIEYLRSESMKILDNELREDLVKLFDKIGKRSGVGDWLALINHREEVRKVGRNFATIDSEYAMKWVQKSFSMHGKVHRGSQNFFPRLLSDFCYKKSFKWKKLADKMSLLFFETGLHDFMFNAIVSYYVRVSSLAYQYLQEMDSEMLETVNFLLKDKSKDESTVTSLNIHEVKSAFSLSFWCEILSAIILVFEILFSLFNLLSI